MRENRVLIMQKMGIAYKSSNRGIQAYNKEMARKSTEARDEARAIARYNRQFKNRAKRFPLPITGDTDLIYRGVIIPLKGGHQHMFGALISQGIDPIPFGWQSAKVWIKDLQEYCEYKNETTTRAALDKLKKKLRRFEEVGLSISIRGNYRGEFSMRLQYKKK